MEKQKVLPSFPTPYPDESLYSVFGRYHVRSGNARYTDTAMDLFGNWQYAFHSSVTTPYRLEFADRWFSKKSGMTALDLMKHNTGYPIYCISGYSWERKRMIRCISSGERDSFLWRIHDFVSITLSHLRYCPECARFEWKEYGEPYWHVTPQIDGMEYCPVHGCRLLESDVSMQDVRRQLLPASAVLTESRLIHMRPRAASSSPVEQAGLDYARDISWLQQYGELYDDRAASVLISQAIDPYHKVRSDGALYFFLLYNLDMIIRFEKDNLCPDFVERTLQKYPAYGSDRINKTWTWQTYEYNRAYAFIPMKVQLLRAIGGSMEGFFSKMSAISIT